MSSILRALRTLPIYVVTGKTKYNSFDADAAVPAMDAGTLNDLLNAGGALGVTQITDITGKVAWKDYIPVQNETGRTVPFSYNANGYFPIKKTSGAIFGPDPDTTALLHFNGTDGATTFTDVSGNTWTRPTNGVAALETSSPFTPKFGSAALLSCPASPANLVGGLHCANGNIATFGASDFTIQFFIYPLSIYATDQATTSFILWTSLNASGHATPIAPVALAFTTARRLGCYISTNGTSYVGGGFVIQGADSQVALNGWRHIALCRSGANLRLFYDGTQVGSTYNIGSTSLFPSTGINLGAVFNSAAGAGGAQFSFVGGYDEVYIQRGVALYTANFTPPVAEFNP